MNFVSFDFALLLAAVLILLALHPAPLWRKIVLMLASCIFYAYWDWRFLSLLILVTITDYYISTLLFHSTDEPKRKRLLMVSVAITPIMRSSSWSCCASTR